MLQPLPAETVFEAKQRSRRNTLLLFFLLAALYLFFANLIGFTILISQNSRVSAAYRSVAMDRIDAIGSAGWFSLLALAGAALHFAWARSKKLSNLLKALGAAQANTNDDVHRRFSNIVHEAEIAAGLNGVRAVVIPTTSCNAFSIEDGHGQRAIGVTEGLLGKLSRPELEAVVAHEAAHLAHGDSRLVSTSCALFSVFSILVAVLRPGRRSGRRSGGGAILALWLISLIGYGLTRLISMAISRNREYFADSDAVHMCKNPLALSDALKKISSGDRGAFVVPEGFSGMFILRPECMAMDERDGFLSDLFSTHPPVTKRMDKLLRWAQQSASLPPSLVSNAGIFIRGDGENWKGPLSSQQAIQSEEIKPVDWVLDSGELKQASQAPGLYREFVNQLGARLTDRNCPRCEVPLVDSQYEAMPVLECFYCAGRLLFSGGIEKAIARRFERFDPTAIEVTKQWRLLQKGSLKELCQLPHIVCPLCSKPMFKCFHTELTRVVIDRCLSAGCSAVWCDGGEIERIQVLIENSYLGPKTKSPGPN